MLDLFRARGWTGAAAPQAGTAVLPQLKVGPTAGYPILMFGKAEFDSLAGVMPFRVVVSRVSRDGLVFHPCASGTVVQVDDPLTVYLDLPPVEATAVFRGYAKWKQRTLDSALGEWAVGLEFIGAPGEMPRRLLGFAQAVLAAPTCPVSAEGE